MFDPELEELLRRAARELRRPVRLDPTFEERVMESVRAVPSRRTGLRVAAWLVRPRTLMISPVGGLVLAAAVLVLVVLAPPVVSLVRPGTSGEGAPPTPVTAAPSRGRQIVRFVLQAPGAQRVSLVGEFNDWDPTATPLRPAAADGSWIVEVQMVPGRHQYAFIIDGSRWAVDPDAPTDRVDDFGAPNSVITIAGRS